MRKSKRATKEKAALDLLKRSEEELFKIKKLKEYPIAERARIFPSCKNRAAYNNSSL